MKEKDEEKINFGTEAINIGAGFLAEINPFFLTIPIITFGINRVLGFTSEKNIANRLKRIEKKLLDKKISIDEFKEKIFILSEHNEYVVRNNLNNLLLNSIPEVIDVYINIIIDLIMKQESSIYEEICEIVSNLNKNDIVLLKKIQEYKESNLIDGVKINNKENKIYDKENEELMFVDRDCINGKNTIFWEAFKEKYQLEWSELVFSLLYEDTSDIDESTVEWIYLTRSFLKLEKLGIIQIDYKNTLGTINSLNIDRFHITIFGLKLLEYI